MPKASNAFKNREWQHWQKKKDNQIESLKIKTGQIR